MSATIAGKVRNSASSIPRFCVSIALASSPALSRRETVGRRIGSKADPDHAERQLVHPVGVIDIGDRPFAEQVAGQRGRNDEVELHRARADGGGKDQLHQPLDLGIDARRAGRSDTPAARQAMNSHVSWSTPPIGTAMAWTRGGLSGVP